MSDPTLSDENVKMRWSVLSLMKAIVSWLTVEPYVK